MTIREASEIVPDVTRMCVEVAADAEERARAEGYAAAARDIVAWLRLAAEPIGMTGWRAWQHAAACIEAGAHRPKEKSDG